MSVPDGVRIDDWGTVSFGHWIDDEEEEGEEEEDEEDDEVVDDDDDDPPPTTPLLLVVLLISDVIAPWLTFRIYTPTSDDDRIKNDEMSVVGCMLDIDSPQRST